MGDRTRGSAGRWATVAGCVSSLTLTALLMGADRDHLENVFVGNLGSAVVFATPTFLAVAALRRRPVLFVAAGVLALSWSPMLWSGLPLLALPGLAYLWAFRRRPRPGPGSRVPIGAVVVVVVVFAMISLAALLRGTEMRCTETASSSVCSTVPTTAAALAGMAATLFTVGLGLILAAPVRDGDGDQAEIAQRAERSSRS